MFTTAAEKEEALDKRCLTRVFQMTIPADSAVNGGWASGVRQTGVSGEQRGQRRLATTIHARASAALDARKMLLDRPDGLLEHRGAAATGW